MRATMLVRLKTKKLNEKNRGACKSQIDMNLKGRKTGRDDSLVPLCGSYLQDVLRPPVSCWNTKQDDFSSCSQT